MKKNSIVACVAIATAVALAGQAGAADIGVAALKYISIDKEASAGKSKTVYVAKVPEAAKNSNDVADISVGLSVAYAGEFGEATAEFNVPAGQSMNKGPGWLVNKDSVAKFVNKDAPGGPTGAKVVVLKPAKLLKLIGKTRGDSPALDMIAAGQPTGSVFTNYSVTSGGVTDNFCSEFASCSFKIIGGGSGRKLVCKGGAADPNCQATSFCGDGIVQGGEQCDDGNPDPADGCTNSCTLCGDGVTTAPEQCDEGPGSCTAPAGNFGNTCYNDTQCDTDPGLSLDGVCSGGNWTSGTCAANCTIPGCGNGLVEPGETCDDGNTLDGDNCPSNCAIATCDPAGGHQLATVSFAGSDNVAGLQVFIEYPEGKVVIPGSGEAIPFGVIDNVQNAFANGQSNDLDYALRQAWVDTAPFSQGALFTINFDTCTGGTAVSGDFTCTVEAAGDVDAQDIEGVTCSVTVP